MSLSFPRLYAGRYELESPIGEGSFSRTFLAHDNVLDRKVAIKVLRREHASNAEFTARFDREAQAAARVSHPNVVAVYDFGKEQGVPFIVMQYVDGTNLRQYLRDEGPLTIEEVVSFTRQVLDGLAAIHDEGIIHRDVKPQNVLIDRRMVAKLTDFGVAFLAQQDATLTQTGATIGTAAYMAPEQATGQRVGPQSDLYAVGVMLYEMLTGRLPFRGDNPVQVLYRHVSEQPVRPRELNQMIPLELEAVVLRALSKMPADRYASARQMREALVRPARTIIPPPQPTATMRTDFEGSRTPQPNPAIAEAASQATRPQRRVQGRRRSTRRNRAWLIPVIFLTLVLAGTGVALALREISGGDGNNSVTGAAVPTPTEPEVPGGAPDGTADDSGQVVPPPEPTATEEPPPTEEPTPTPTPEPSPTPEPTATPEPTETPEPEPTATPEEETSTPEPDGSGPPLQPVSEIPAEWQQGQGMTFGRDEFVGGGAYRREDGVLYDRPAAHLYARSTDYSATTVTFEATERPTDYIGLIVVGMDDERPEAVPIRIRLNDKVIWEGPSPFGNEQWTAAAWQINALGWLHEGQNSLTIEMLVPEGPFGLPPWILLTEAAIYWD